MLALSKRNTNVAEVIIFLHRLTSVLVEYFKELEEESIRDNFVIIYELLDEMMDFGYPQTTESKILQEYVALLLSFIVFTGDQFYEGILHKSHISLKSRPGRQWLSLMPYHGDLREFVTARTRYSWTSSRASTCSYDF